MATQKNDNELYFEWWLEELKSVGLVKVYERECETYKVQQPVVVFYKQHYVRKEAIFRNFDLVSPIVYTPDYEVVFSEKLMNKLFGFIDTDTMTMVEYEPLEKGNYYQETLFYTTVREFEDFRVIFDVKPPSKALQFSGKLGSSREFPVKRALLFENHKLIANKVVPVGSETSLFKKTFMPKRYRYTDGGTMLRKIKGKYRSLEEWLNEKDIKL